MLTDATCKASVFLSDKNRVRFSDSGGLYLEVSVNGSKRWFFKYRKDGKETRLAIGSYPTISLADAHLRSSTTQHD